MSGRTIATTFTQSPVALRVDIALGDDERCDAASPALGRDARLGCLDGLDRNDFDGDGAPTDDVVDRSSRASSMTSGASRDGADCGCDVLE
jgi:hypothetical protein